MGSNECLNFPPVTGTEAIKVFAKLGYIEIRVKGSHHHLKKEGHPILLTVPVHGQQTLPPGTLRRLIRDADITPAIFVELLD